MAALRLSSLLLAMLALACCLAPVAWGHSGPRFRGMASSRRQLQTVDFSYGDIFGLCGDNGHFLQDGAINSARVAALAVLPSGKRRSLAAAAATATSATSSEGRTVRSLLGIPFDYRRLGDPNFNATIKVYWHVIYANDQQRIDPGRRLMVPALSPGNVPIAVIQEQIRVLNFVFADVGFSFVLAGVDWTMDSFLFHGINETSVFYNAQVSQLLTLRNGTLKDLNVFSLEMPYWNDENAYPVPVFLTGDFTYPQQAAVNGRDYVLIDYQVLPSIQRHRRQLLELPLPYEDHDNSGLQLVHHVGHWLGLYHPYTFDDVEGGTCSNKYQGDRIVDTPLMQWNYVNMFNCTLDPNAAVDSCPGDPGKDPVNNFMVENTDDCYNDADNLQMYGFTNQQAIYMQRAWAAYRYNK